MNLCSPLKAFIIAALFGTAVLGCGSDSSSKSPNTPSAGSYEFALETGSAIKASDGTEESLTGRIVTSPLDLGPNYRFSLKIDDLKLQSANYLISSSDGRINVTSIGTLGMSVFGTVNDTGVQLVGGGGPQTYVIRDQFRAVASELRGVVITDGEFTVTIYARR
jgi:hypothetical protein